MFMVENCKLYIIIYSAVKNIETGFNFLYFKIKKPQQIAALL